MTTKTHIAMFAIAAFAIVGMTSMPSAYAGNYPSFDHTYVSGVNIEDDDVACGSSDHCAVSMWAVAGNDYINITYGVDGNTSCDEVYIGVVSSTGWSEYKLGGYNIDSENNYTTVTGPNDLNVDDEVTVTGYFYDCS